MPTLAERRQQLAAQGNSQAGDFIKFKAEGETRYLRFLFDDASTIESHRKFWDEQEKKWIIDGDKGTYKIVFNCVEYDKGGVNPRRVRWEISEYLYNEYLSPYVEKETPASKNVWEVKVRRPGTMDISYVAFKVDGASDLTYPIPDVNAEQAPAPAATPSYATTTSAPAQAPAPAAQPVSESTQTQPAPAPAATASPVVSAASQPAPVQASPRKSKYF